MIGRLRDGRLEVGGTRTGSGLRRVRQSQRRPIAVARLLLGVQDNSDHWPFFERQIPSCMLHTGLHDDYHRPSDDIDKINRAGPRVRHAHLLDIIVTAANADTLPAYRTAGRFDSLATQKSRQQRDAATSRGDWPGVAPPRLGITWRTDEAEPGSVYITHVAAGSPAAAAGLAAGDRVYEVNGQPFSKESDFRDTVYGLLDTSATEFTLLVETRGHTRTLVVRLQPHTLGCPSRLLGPRRRCDYNEISLLGLSHGDVAKLADALDLGSSSERSAGSIPVIPTFFSEHTGQRQLPAVEVR